MTEVEFIAELQVRAIEPTTGATCPLGFLTDKGEWEPVSLIEGPGMFTQPECPISEWLADGAETVTDPNSAIGPADRGFYELCVERTVERLRWMALDIAQGRSPLPDDHAVFVFPVDGAEQIVYAGNRVPAGITHIRDARFGAWVEIDQFRQP